MLPSQPLWLQRFLGITGLFMLISCLLILTGKMEEGNLWWMAASLLFAISNFTSLWYFYRSRQQKDAA